MFNWRNILSIRMQREEKRERGSNESVYNAHIDDNNNNWLLYLVDTMEVRGWRGLNHITDYIENIYGILSVAVKCVVRR